jgi:hypothetical protein
MNAFERWWNEEGSSMRPKENEDYEEFAKRITAIAWSNGEYTERDERAKAKEDHEPR